MKYAYKTKYGSPEAKLAKEAGAKWDRNLRMWLSPEEIPGLAPVQPSPEFLQDFGMKDLRKRALVEKAKMLILEARKKENAEKIAEEIVEKVRQKLDKENFVDLCCIAAVEEFAKKK